MIDYPYWSILRSGAAETYLKSALAGWLYSAGIVGIFASGSRGAYLGFFLSTAVFLVAWPVRLARMSRVSLAPAFFGIAGAVSLAALVLLVEVSPAFHNRVLGGGAQASSNEGRRIQWEAGLPLIEANPITGHGLATGGYDINSSIDTYVLSLLVETGVPGLIFFAGIVCVPIWFGLRNYIYDLSEFGRAFRCAGLQLCCVRDVQVCSVATGESPAFVFPACHGNGSELRASIETGAGQANA